MNQEFNPEAGANMKEEQSHKVRVVKEQSYDGESKNQKEQNKEQEAIKSYIEQRKQAEQFRRNIEVIRTPIQKLQMIEQNKLDDGITETFCESFNQVLIKFLYVLIPRQDKGAARLRGWDWWGLYLLGVTYLFFFDDKSKTLFLFFSLVIAGYILYYNIVSIGGRVSFFQAISILGYCLFPIFLMNFVVKLLAFINIKDSIVNKVLFFASTFWSIAACKVFISVNVPESRKLVAVYPAALYYIYITFYFAFT